MTSAFSSPTKTTDMARIPTDLRREIAAEIIRRANELGWDDLLMSERTAMYEKWAADPELGGRLSVYLPRDSVRVWIKDGPMKEYARARRGLGTYADLIEDPVRHEEGIATSAFGQDWSVVPGSIGVKPAHFNATNGVEQCIVFWGHAGEAKHLVWAAINTALNESPTIVIVANRRNPTTHDDRRLIERVGRRTSTPTHFLTL
jgi:hypothetical protein